MQSFVQSHLPVFEDSCTRQVKPFKSQLLKWVGSKQRYAHEIASYIPAEIGTYYEPFLGSGAVLGTLAPTRAVGSDVLEPLIEIWQTLRKSPDALKAWYSERWRRMMDGVKTDVYEQIKASYNANPNGADLLFLSRSCYGGVIRFRKEDGHISTPCGPHKPMSPESFSHRVELWHDRTSGTHFSHLDFRDAMAMARPGDFIYCDPPYSDSQAILYGSQAFSFGELLNVIADCKSRGVYVALSIDGTKRSGNKIVDLPIPEGLFEREIFVSIGRSMLKRLQMEGKSLEGEEVSDRLLLTY